MRVFQPGLSSTRVRFQPGLKKGGVYMTKHKSARDEVCCGRVTFFWRDDDQKT